MGLQGSKEIRTREEPPLRAATAEYVPFVPIELEYDEGGFVKSFTVDQQDLILEFYKKYGFVVIADVLDEAEVAASVNELWSEIEDDPSSFGEVKRDDPATWLSFFPGMVKLGMVGSTVCAGPAAWSNRQSSKLKSAYACVLGTDDLLVSVDRYGLMRPTVGVMLPSDDGEVVPTDKPEWKTRSKWLHWDLNPWTWLYPFFEGEYDIERYKDPSDGKFHWEKAYGGNSFITENNERTSPQFNGFDKVQGLIALADSRADDGGFLTVPGYHVHMKQWVDQNDQKTMADFVALPEEDQEIAGLAKAITMRAGSLVIWSSLMPHCNYPNNSSRPRMCQYIKMFPKCAAPAFDGYLESRGRALRKHMKDFTPSEDGMNVFGLR